MTNVGTGTSSAVTQNHVGSQISQDEANSNMGTGQRSGEETSKSEGTQAGGTLQQTERSTKTTSTGTGTRTKDFNDDMSREQHDMHHNIINNNQSARRNKSKSTEDMNVGKNFVWWETRSTVRLFESLTGAIHSSDAISLSTE